MTLRKLLMEYVGSSVPIQNIGNFLRRASLVHEFQEENIHLYVVFWHQCTENVQWHKTKRNVDDLYE